MITIHTTKDTPVETLQQQIDAAMRDNHLRQTRQPLPNPQAAGSRLSGETIYHLMKETTPCA